MGILKFIASLTQVLFMKRALMDSIETETIATIPVTDKGGIPFVMSSVFTYQ